MRIAFLVILLIAGLVTLVAPFLKNHEACSPEQEEEKEKTALPRGH